MPPAVTSVVARDDFTLHVVFENGESGVLDMKPYLDFGVFRSIGTLAAFKSVRVAFDTVEWGNGIDLDPEFVHTACVLHPKH
ncbi:MAG: DUF2442 domain-containing protein [Ignavibacteria bacterium]|nr:DUF2442 domain-containing protein [Ignavibacteria bacterium]